MKNNDWKSRLGIVYSTNPDFEYQTDEQEEVHTLPPEKQTLYVQIDKHKRAGKEVVLITNFVGTSDDLDALAKTLKTKCGCGGSAKDGEIIIQGNAINKVIDILVSLRYKVKRRG